MGFSFYSKAVIVHGNRPDNKLKENKKMNNTTEDSNKNKEREIIIMTEEYYAVSKKLNTVLQ